MADPKTPQTAQTQPSAPARTLQTVQAEIAQIAATKPADRSPAQNAQLQDLEVERQKLLPPPAAPPTK